MSHPIHFDPPKPAELSQLLDGYDVDSLIATGGMGAVYRATQISLDRPVAIKLLPAEFGEDPSFRDQFTAEARAMAKLNHANLIAIYDFGEANGMPYIVMELVEGKSLYYSSYGKVIDQAIAVKLVIGICKGLAHAHAANIIHRDIKPANILLDLDANPKIGDFGLASASDSDEADDGPVYGTPGYAAPEILSSASAIGVPSDLFAVGVILYELLTGEMPGEPASPPSSMSKCDPRLDPIFKKATRRNPALRYQSAAELADDLEKLLPDLGREKGGPKLLSAADQAAKKAAPIKRRLTAETESEPQPGKPKLIALPKDGAPPAASAPPGPAKAPAARLKPLPPQDSKTDPKEASPPPAAAAKPASPAMTVQTGSNWPIIRNLIIIALLIPAIWFAWGIYQDKQARIAKEQNEKKMERQAKEAERKAALEEEQREAKRRAEKKKEEAALEAKRAIERERLLAIENSKTPMERLAEYRTALYNGRRDRFPDNTIDRSTHYWFFVNEPMTWTEACEFAERHGGHLATPSKQADLDILARKMGREYRRIWIGGGARGKGDWAWVDGDEWTFKNPGTTLGSCASLSNTGVIRARPNAEKNPFVIQWSQDGSNEGSLASQLERLVPTLSSPSPAWPPSTVAHESRHFLLVHREVSWEEADEIAGTAEGHLAVYSEPMEAIFLRKYFESALLPDQSVWLGARRSGDTWSWSTGEAWEKAYWAPTSPDGDASASALRYLNASGAAGWDDAAPVEGNANAFIIEWSPDGDRTTAPVAGDDAAGNGQVAKLRGVGRRLVNKELEDYRKFLLGNRDTLSRQTDFWFRMLSKNNQTANRAFYTEFDETLPVDGDLLGELPFESMPAGVQELLVKAQRRQTLRKTELDEKLASLRTGYLKKLVDLRDRLEKGDLKSQLEAVDREIQAVGQTAQSFREHFE